jgi:hypothetical protein
MGGGVREMGQVRKGMGQEAQTSATLTKNY